MVRAGDDGRWYISRRYKIGERRLGSRIGERVRWARGIGSTQVRQDGRQLYK